MSLLRHLLSRVAEGHLLVVLLVTLVPLLAVQPGKAVTLHELVDWKTVGALAGLLVLSPAGNPQNLVIWQSTTLSFMDFVAMMLPLGLALTVLVLAAIPLASPSLRTVATALPGLVITCGSGVSREWAVPG